MVINTLVPPPSRFYVTVIKTTIYYYIKLLYISTYKVVSLRDKSAGYFIFRESLGKF